MKKRKANKIENDYQKNFSPYYQQPYIFPTQNSKKKKQKDYISKIVDFKKFSLPLNYQQICEILSDPARERYPINQQNYQHYFYDQRNNPIQYYYYPNNNQIKFYQRPKYRQNQPRLIFEETYPLYISSNPVNIHMHGNQFPHYNTNPYHKAQFIDNFYSRQFNGQYNCF